MSVYTYSLSNKRRDLSPALNTVTTQKKRFISKFKTAARATNQKHEWHEDQIQGRGFTVTAYASGKATLSAADYAKCAVGTRFVTSGSPAVFKITAMEDASSKITATVHAANGDTTKTALAANDKCKIISRPIKELSGKSDADETRRIIGTNYNITQIFHKVVEISDSALATMTTDGVENDITRQTEYAIDQLQRDLNRCAIWGVRTEWNQAGGVYGEAGGLVNMAADGLSVDAASERISAKLINDAVMKIMEEGGEPTTIYCTPEQARVLANEYKKSLVVQQDDQARGVFVASIVNEANGRMLTIFADPDFCETEAYVADDDCFAVSFLQPLYDKDTTDNATNGISRKVVCEVTFEFRNVKQRVCRIKNLKGSSAALTEIETAAKNLNVTGDTITLTASTVTVTQAPAL